MPITYIALIACTVILISQNYLSRAQADISPMQSANIGDNVEITYSKNNSLQQIDMRVEVLYSGNKANKYVEDYCNQIHGKYKQPINGYEWIVIKEHSIIQVPPGIRSAEGLKFSPDYDNNIYTGVCYKIGENIYISQIPKDNPISIQIGNTYFL